MLQRALLAIPGALLLLFALVAAGGALGSNRASALTNCATNSAAFDPGEQALFDALNGYRQANGIAPLKISPNLSRAAAFMSEDLKAKGYWDHFEPSGRSPFQRAFDCGYPSTNTGENLAISYSGANALALWKTSPGHNANMLASQWKVVGIGQAGGYWAMDFGTFDDSGQAPATSGPTNTPTASSTSSPTPTPTATPTPGPNQPSLFPIRRAMLQMIATE